MNVLALFHGLVQVCSDDLTIQVFGFVAFTFFRCFLFAVVFSFMASFISSSTAGKGAGFMNLPGGLCMFVNIYLANVAVLRYESFFLPNLIYTAPIVLCMIASFYMSKWARFDAEVAKIKRCGTSILIQFPINIDM